MLKLILLIAVVLLILYLLTINSMDSNTEQYNNVSSENKNDMTMQPIAQIQSVLIPNNLHLQSNERIQTESLNEKCVTVDGPGIKKCQLGKCGLQNLYPILDPKFNMREAAKQCLLLEDHLNNTKKRCFDCIRKHFLIIDGFLEEAISLEKNNNERNYYRHLYLNWVKIEKLYAKNPLDDNNLDNVSKNIRFFRKPLLEKYFDQVSEYVD